MRTLLYFFLLAFIFCYRADAQQQRNDAVTPKVTTVHADYSLSTLTKAYKKSNEGQTIGGYRIQIFSGARQPAFDLKAEVLRQLRDIECNVVYESPDYKVQLGNYRTKLEAEKALLEYWPIYKGAFYVKTQIYPPKLALEK